MIMKEISNNYTYYFNPIFIVIVIVIEMNWLTECGNTPVGKKRIKNDVK